MSSNASLIQKADLALADLAANGGELSPEQTAQFVQILIDSPTVLAQARVVTMAAGTKKINKIGFGSRTLRPAVSGVALAEADRTKPDLGQISLNAKEQIAEVHIPYDVLEENVEGGNIAAPMGSSAGGVMDVIVTMLAQRAALDLEELGLLGDTSNSTDPYLAQVDGIIKKATSHIVDCKNAAMTKDLLKMALKAMPPKYQRIRNEVGFFLSTDNEIEYRDSIANRSQGVGDVALTTNNQLAAYGSPVFAASLMPNSSGIYTNPNNLVFGIRRKVNVEYDKDIRAREFIVVMTTRVDFAIEEPDAVVKLINIAG